MTPIIEPDCLWSMVLGALVTFLAMMLWVDHLMDREPDEIPDCLASALLAEIKRLRNIEAAAKKYVESLNQNNLDYRSARLDLLRQALPEKVASSA